MVCSSKMQLSPSLKCKGVVAAAIVGIVIVVVSSSSSLLLSLDHTSILILTVTHIN